MNVILDSVQKHGTQLFSVHSSPFRRGYTILDIAIREIEKEKVAVVVASDSRIDLNSIDGFQDLGVDQLLEVR